MDSVTAAANVNLSGVRNGEATSVAIMLIPAGSTSMSGCAMIAYTWFEPGTIMSTINTAPTAPNAYTRRFRNSMRCETNPPSGLGFAAGSDMGFACGSLLGFWPGGLLAPGLPCTLFRRGGVRGVRSQHPCLMRHWCVLHGGIRQGLYQVVRRRIGRTDFRNTGECATGCVLKE